MLRPRIFSNAQVDSLRNYTESPALNAAIRADRLTADVRSWIEAIDSSLAALPIAIRATRAVSATKAFAQLAISSPRELGDLVGVAIEERAYLSVCLQPDPPVDILRSIEATQRLVLELLVPAGTPVVYVEAFTTHRGEYELIVMRGARFLIVSEPTFVSLAAGWRVRAIIDTEEARDVPTRNRS